MTELPCAWRSPESSEPPANQTGVSWQPPKKGRPNPMHDAKPFWLMSLLRTVITMLTAYFIAVFLELVLIHISQLPHGPLWVSEFSGPFLFILTLGVVVLLSIPYFMKEWDAGLRSFSMFSSTFLIAISVFTQTGAFDPNKPLVYVTQHVFVPLQRTLRY